MRQREREDERECEIPVRMKVVMCKVNMFSILFYLQFQAGFFLYFFILKLFTIFYQKLQKRKLDFSIHSMNVGEITLGRANG